MVFCKKPVIIAAASVTACGLLSVFALTTYADKGSESGLVEANSITINPVGYYGETAETALPVIENDFLNETSESLLLNTVEEALTEETETAEMSEEIAELLNEEPESVISSKLIVPSAEEINIDLYNTDGKNEFGLTETFIAAHKYSEVYSANEGVVEYCGLLNGYGLAVVIQADNGDHAIYSHLAFDDGTLINDTISYGNMIPFENGDKITKGQLIGYTGFTGLTKQTGVGYTYVLE